MGPGIMTLRMTLRNPLVSLRALRSPVTTGHWALRQSVGVPPPYTPFRRRFAASNLFVIGEVSFELCGSHVVEQVNNDIDGASDGSRYEQNADDQPEESTSTLKFALSFRHAGGLVC
jgi:hypothetical protein